MKKAILVCCFLVMVSIVFAQNAQQQKIDSACQLVKKYWAEKNAGKIYAMAGDEFKKQLSEADFSKACTEKLFPMGPMKTYFEVFENGINKYKAVFTSDSLYFFLSLDNQNKLANFLFQPYHQ